MTFTDVISYLESNINLEKDSSLFNKRTYRLDRMNSILNKLGNPQNSYNIIHVAGSKGKGSVCSFISSGLVASGEKTGLFLSPHVSDYRERFQINNKFASDDEYIYTAKILMNKLSKIKIKPTAFEMYTAFALQLFKDTACTYAVLETGLGGRLDATNVVLPKAVVLTTIELEHTEILGNTLKEIAIEKSKIIKYNIPTFTYEQKDEVLHVFKDEAFKNNSKFYYLPECMNELKEYTYYAENLKLKGFFQKKNYLLSLLVLKYFNKLSDFSAHEMTNTTLPGRFESIKFDNRILIMDGSHTENSIKGTVDTFKNTFKKKGTCIFGCVKGKNVNAMAEIIIKNFNNIIITTPGTWKKSDIFEVFTVFQKIKRTNKENSHSRITLIPDNKFALKTALDNTDKGDYILICGSFYLVGEFKKLI